MHLFVARVQEAPDAEPEPGLELLRRPFDELVTAARSGRVRDVKTAVALLLADARGSARPVG